MDWGCVCVRACAWVRVCMCVCCVCVCGCVGLQCKGKDELLMSSLKPGLQEIAAHAAVATYCGGLQCAAAC